jgi:formamidopyrimidine-DNA glycosylase
VPELPEVETVRRGLAQWVVGRTIAAIEVHHPRAVRRHLPGADDFTAALLGRRVVGVRRRGKYLWLPLDSGDAVLAHLGMSGQLLMLDAAAAPGPHLRVAFTFTDTGPQLRFVDQRTFGGLSVSIGGAELPPEIAHIAPDLLEDAFDDDAFHQKLRSRRTGLKRALLDQTLVSGVGNIYADEGLWRAKLHYARATETMRRPESVRLLDGVRSVMASALEQGGTSFDSLYVNVNGDSGYFDRSLAVYGRKYEPCPRCGTSIRRESFMNRSSYFCPNCQPRPRNPHW